MADLPPMPPITPRSESDSESSSSSSQSVSPSGDRRMPLPPVPAVVETHEEESSPKFWKSKHLYGFLAWMVGPIALFIAIMTMLDPFNSIVVCPLFIFFLSDWT